jgi:alpha-methylacyl-CoA racemase
VIASLTGWGQTGPYAQLPGHDLGFLALAGMLAPSAGESDPRVPRMQWGDLAAGGLTAALRIASAVYDRTRTGEGAWLDIAMLDGLVGLQQTQFAQLAAGAPPDPYLTGGVPIYNLYRCADGRLVSLAALEPPFLAVLSRETSDLSAEGLAALFATAPRDAWVERLGGACVAPVLSLDEVAKHPQIVARGLFSPGAAFPHPPTGPVEGPVPELGEHTEEELERAVSGQRSAISDQPGGDGARHREAGYRTE